MHRHAGAHADGPDAHIGEVDTPGLLVRVVAAPAGEGDHASRIGASQSRNQPLDFEPALVSGLYLLVNA